MSFLKKVDGDSLLKVDGDKLLLVESVSYSLSAGTGSFVITGTDATLSKTIKVRFLAAQAGSFTILGGDCTLGFAVPRIDST